MATPAPVPRVKKTVTIVINADGSVDQPNANANVGDTIKFDNQGTVDRVVQFPTPPGSSQPYYPISLLVEASDKEKLYATDPGTVNYTINTPEAMTMAATAPTAETTSRVAGGPYQIIVGSG